MAKKIKPIEEEHHNSERIVSDNIELKLKEAEEQINTYIKDLQRLQAEFENHIKRSNKEKENISLITKHEICKKILPIVDEFEITIKVAEKTSEKGHITEGIKMVFNHLYKLLNDQGMNSIGSIGKKFDPFVHEVVKKVDSNEEEGIILEEIQKGYLFQGNLLRPAKVIISNGKKEVTTENVHLEVENE